MFVPFRQHLRVLKSEESKELDYMNVYVIRLFGSYGISTFVGYLMPKPFL